MRFHYLCALIWVGLLFGNGRPARSQSNPFIFRHITMDDGLLSNHVRSILQDDKGFMWFSTDNGLQRYDGTTFISYHHAPADSLSLSSDDLLVMLMDKQQQIWTTSFLAGVNRFDPLSNTCTRISDLSKESFEKLFLTKSLSMDAAGNIWLMAVDNIACYNTGERRLTFLKHLFPDGVHPYFVTAQYDSATNQLWMGDENNGICMYDLNERVFYSRYHNPAHLPVFDIRCRPLSLFLDRERHLWISSYDAYLTKYNLVTHSSTVYPLAGSDRDLVRLSAKPPKGPTMYISPLREDAHGNIWMASERVGLIRYVPATDSFNVIPSGETVTSGLHFNEAIHCVYEDREGDIWIGTDQGINVFNPSRQQFHFFGNDRYETMDFLQTTAGALWVASWGGGVTVFDSLMRPEHHFAHQNGDPSSLGEPGSRVWTLYRDSHGRILAGCQHGYISIAGPRVGSFTNVHPEGLQNTTIINMRADKTGNTWMGMYWGIGKWNAQSGEAVSYRHFSPYEGVDSASASDVLPDNEGHVWVGTLGMGLQQFDVSSQRFTALFVPDKNDPHSISSALITCMVPLSDSTMAIGTGSGGIDLFNTRTRQFEAISTADGLPSNSVKALYFMAPFTLWASAGNMICKIDLRDRHVILFGQQDGIKDLDFTCPHMYRMQDGRILAGYKGGFLYFYPDSLTGGGPPPDVSFTGIRIFNRPISVDSVLQHSDTLSLPYWQNFITLQYASLSYWEGNRINYAYKLEGVDKDWVNAHNQRFANYTNLPGGSYRFSVRCDNSDGVYSKDITSLVLVIRPPFWKTGWFKWLVAFCVTLALYALYRYRIRQILALQTVRNEISKDLHDDVGSTLSSISILSQVAKDKMEEGQQEQSASIMTRINGYALEMVEKMGDIVWAVNAVNDNIQDIVGRLKNAYMETTASRDIQLHFTIDPAFETRVLSIQVRKNIYLICKEAMNNAIKYAGCRHIEVSFTLAPGALEVRVADDGHGFDPSQVKLGNGLVNMEARAAEMKATLVVTSSPGGTTVMLRKPLPKYR